jgi:hypothetical protein
MAAVDRWCIANGVAHQKIFVISLDQKFNCVLTDMTCSRLVVPNDVGELVDK